MPYDQCVRLGQALMAAGRHVEFFPTPGSGRGFFWNPVNPWAARVWPWVVMWARSLRA